MRVGVYVDGFNLYFGARSVCGRGTRGWRWLDVRALAERALTWEWLERGAYVDRVVYCRPRLAHARWPVQTRDAHGADMPGATFMVSYLDREEKGTDVNLATHLLIDVLGNRVDAAIVVSNDSDLALPIRVARVYVPVGLVNPGAGPLAGRLRGVPAEGARGHWWRRLERADYRACQMPKRVGALCRPEAW